MGKQAMIEPGIEVKISEHESGRQKTYFFSFDCTPATKDKFTSIFKSATQELGETPITEVFLKADQKSERQILEGMGFLLDGIKYGLKIERLSALIGEKKLVLPSDFQVRPLNYDEDIEELVGIEKVIHQADQSSRVNFVTEASIQSMKKYYRRVADDNGVFVLIHRERLVGVVAFMKNSQSNLAVEVSSIGLALTFQGKGLFLPFMLKAFEMSPFKNFKMLTGVTTTSRLITAADKNEANILGYLLSKHT
jgi:hypothetical protein